MPLHVFEPRYRAMVKDCLETHKAMAIALIRESGERDPHGHPAIEAVAGAGIIVDHVKLPDGRYNILLQGRARVRLTEHPFVPPYRRAKAELLASTGNEPPHSELAALLASAAAFAGDIRARDPEFDFRVPSSSSSAAAVDLAAHHLVLDARDRQRLLETLDTTLRVQRATEALALQHAALREGARGPMN